MSGWIKLHRQIQDNPLYFSEPFTRSSAWIDLILLANHKDAFFYKRGVKIDVKVGQVGYDIESLSKRWQWSRGKVERFIKQLENEQQVVRQKSNVTTLISIVKYKEYQSDSKPNSKPSSKANGQQTVKQTDTNKNEENENNEKKVLENPKSERQIILDEWVQYRKQKSKALSELSITKLIEEFEGRTIDEIKFVVDLSIKNGWQGLFWEKYVKPLGQSKDLRITDPDRDHYEYIMAQVEIAKSFQK